MALAIVAIALSVLLPWLGDSLAESRRMETYVEATMLAESALDTIGVASPLTDGEDEEQRKGLFRIRAAVHRYLPAEALAESVGYQVPYELTATVAWQEGLQSRSVTLKTVRLGAPR